MIIAIHKLNLIAVYHFYIDVSLNSVNLYIIQYRPSVEAFSRISNNINLVEVSIIYNSFIFSITQKLYLIYKKELYALIKFYNKYDYLYKHLYNTSIIHTDYRPFIYFMKSDLYEDIYNYWADSLRRLNIEIKYIFGHRNRVANGLFKTLFYSEKKDLFVKTYTKLLLK